jgi:hypothetical protein
MLFLDKATTFSLDHRAYCRLRGAPPLFVTAGSEGRVSLCRFAPEPALSHVNTTGKITAVCPHPFEPLLALIEGESGRLVLLRFDGTPLFDDDPPLLHAESPDWMIAGYTDCQFDVSGTYLLCAATTSENGIEVQLRETKGWSVVDRTAVADPFGGSLASFHSTASPQTWALWLAAGQDGQCVQWVTRDGGRLRTAIEWCLTNMIPPAFSPGGDEFLTIDEHGTLQRYRYPPAERLGACQSPYGDGDPFGSSLCYLDGARALAGSDSGRIAVVDILAMRVANELVIEGHEPRPTMDYHPSLAGDGPPCTDISYFERIGNHLIVVHKLHHPVDRQRDGSLRIRFDEWRDGLLCFPLDYILEKYPA